MLQKIVSQRTMKILKLNETNQGIPQKTKDTSVEVSEGAASAKFNKSLEKIDPISHWVIEVEPEILKKQFCKAADFKNNTTVNNENSRNHFKCDKWSSSDKNKLYEKYLENLQSETELTSKSESRNENDGQMGFFKSFKSHDKGKETEEKLNQTYQNVHKTISTTAQWASETNTKESLYSTEINIKKLKLNEANDNDMNNVSNRVSSNQLHVIVVPPKEAVENLSIGSDFDLPIIIEKSLSISKNEESQFLTENYIDCSEDNENNNFDRFNVLDIQKAASANNKTENYDIVPKNSSNILLEVTNLPQSLTSTPKKIHVLSQYILKQNDPHSVSFTAETNSKEQNWNEPNSNGMSDMIKFENPCHVPIAVFPTQEASTYLPSTSNFEVLGIRKDPYVFESDEIQNAKNNVNNSGEIENKTFDSLFNDSSGNRDTTDATNIENNIPGSHITTEQSVKIGISTELNKSTKKNINNHEVEIERTNKKHYKDKRTFCFFCEKDVSHFSRHLTTWHQNEIEVQRLQSYESKSKEKRLALGVLGKRGNYVKNRSTLQLRAVKRVQSGIISNKSEFLPCPHCLGFYKKKSLYRHTKTCTNRPSSEHGKRQNSQSRGQTALLFGQFKSDELLQKELFPRMRADEVSLTAKKDSLICNYAYSYMKGRRSKGNLDFVRTSVRNLARLLEISKESDKNIKGLIDLLRPTFFKTIIRGVNIIGGYNEKDDIYESPTVALNFGTLLKKCCDLAIIKLLQEPNTEAQRKEIKILKTLIESQWANEVSAQASLNLNSKKWNKEELLPLTSDLKKLKDYLERIAQQTFEELKSKENDKFAYNSLKEILYCQIILMNRRRPAEVAQIKVETYKSINLDVQETEFESCLTATEKILLNSCSRMVIRGKRGRGVPILLSQNMRKQFDLLINLRDNFIQNNDYIFHTTGKNFIDGTKVLYKYAKKSGIQNPKSISATRLRKHLATVTQLLQFSEGDLEQLSRFMGHTLQTHCNFYRLSDSTYQTAKISKLLLLASEGGLEKYKGLDLSNINIDLNPISEDCDVEDMITEQTPETYSTNISNDNLSQNLNEYTDKKNKSLISVKHPWSNEQKKIIATYFAEHIKKKKSPKQSEVNIFLEEYPGLFEDRKWTSIKAVVYNFYTGKLIIPIT